MINLEEVNSELLKAMSYHVTNKGFRISDLAVNSLNELTKIV
jgi:hypothetical protein